MGTGYLITETRTNFDVMPVGAKVTVKNAGGAVLYELDTDENGKTGKISLETVDREHTLNPDFPGHPYFSYTVETQAPGFETIITKGVHIFDGETAILPVTMIPMLQSETSPAQFDINIGPQAVEMTGPRNQEGITPPNPRVLRHVIIPDIMTVHLSRPNIAAQSVRVPFIEYIKNVASHEIYPTWPASALTANIHAIVTFALNRVFTEWYRVQGRAFDITNSTAFDQYFVYGGTIYQSISSIVDRVFNQYVRRAGQTSPFFTSFCNGTTATCAGLSQWGTVGLANSGYTPIQILRQFYPANIELAEANIFMGITESYPGSPLSLGSTGLNVQIMQRFLNRIRRNYPLIPQIANENGVFGQDTQNAVRVFQQVFDLTQDGIIGKATWNKISYIYTAVARLAELDSEGTNFTIGTVPPSVTLRVGSTGHDVVTLQYILSYIAQYYPVTSPTILDGSFGTATQRAVMEFQRMMGLPEDGVVNAATWAALYNTYWGIKNNAPTPPPAPPPGNYFNYTVVSGDTLWILAQRFGTTVQAIRNLNNLTSDALSIGQVLRIPTTGGGGTTPPPPPPPGNYFNYTVVSGDTLWILAQRFGTTVQAIRTMSNLTSDALSIGQVLRIPTTGGGGGTTPPPPGNFINYTIRSGDSLWTLAQRFGTTVQAIRNLNNLTSDALSIGQVIRIPGSFFQYTVRSGDTLFLLSQRFGVPVDRIRAINNIPGNALSIGQVLLIPGA